MTSRPQDPHKTMNKHCKQDRREDQYPIVNQFSDDIIIIFLVIKGKDTSDSLFNGYFHG